MREIKFRAWDKHKDEFHNWDKVSEDKFYRYTNNLRYVLQQYTGLKDKNGKEIYEGDILENIPNRDVQFIVGFGENGENNNFGFNLISIKLNNVYSFDTSIKKMEVIGNIYENPELLEVK